MKARQSGQAGQSKHPQSGSSGGSGRRDNRSGDGKTGRPSRHSGEGRTQGRPAKSGRGAAGPRTGSYAGQPASGRGRGEAGVPRTPVHVGELTFKSYRRKGEWMELRLPDTLVQAPISVVLRYLPLPQKFTSKLMSEHGIVKNGTQLRLKLFPSERAGLPADWIEMNVLYEDDFILVVNKAVGIEVHPSVQGQRGTLAHGVAAYYEATGQNCRVRPIHRLDKDTTGPVLFAKNEAANVILERAMKEKKLDRLYVAVAEGRVTPDRGVIDKPIGQDRNHSTKRRVSETGEPAVTKYEVAERLKDHSLLRLKLETGRTHQIRVHLSSIGYPIAGDGMYGGTRKFISRQALHGEVLTLHHPWSGDRMSVKAPMPDDMNQLLKQLRNHRTKA